MMPIESEPSTDGLVMEPVEVELGPLGTVLPGGLVARVTLDGDIVAACSLEATLEAPRSKAAGVLVPDRLAAAAWREAASAVRAPAGGWASLADVELERAASHHIWLRALGRLLGWTDLVDAALAAVRPILDVRTVRAGRAPEATGARRPSLSPSEVDGRLVESGDGMARLRRLLADDRRLVRRTQGCGRVDPETAKAAAVGGPVARAAGLRVDRRLDEPRYAELGFEAVERLNQEWRIESLMRGAGGSGRSSRGCLRRGVDTVRGSDARLHPQRRCSVRVGRAGGAPAWLLLGRPRYSVARHRTRVRPHDDRVRSAEAPLPRRHGGRRRRASGHGRPGLHGRVFQLNIEAQRLLDHLGIDFFNDV